MKLFFCLLFCFAMNLNVFSSTYSYLPVFKPNEDSLYLIVGLKETDQANINALTTKFNTIENCKVLLFCKNLNVFVLTFNSSVNKERSEIFSDLEKNIGSSIKIYLKEGETKDILKNCYLSDSQITPEIKTLLAN